MHRRDSQQLQSVLNGFTTASKELLDHTQQAIDNILKSLHIQNAELMKMNANSVLTQGTVTNDLRSVATNLSDATSKLFGINEEIAHISHGLRLLFPNNIEANSPENTQLLDKKLAECIKLNNRLFTQLTLLTSITGQTNNIELNTKAVDALSNQINALIQKNHAINDELRKDRIADRADKKTNSISTEPEEKTSNNKLSK